MAKCGRPCPHTRTTCTRAAQSKTPSSQMKQRMKTHGHTFQRTRMPRSRSQWVYRRRWWESSADLSWCWSERLLELSCFWIYRSIRIVSESRRVQWWKAYICNNRSHGPRLRMFPWINEFEAVFYCQHRPGNLHSDQAKWGKPIKLSAFPS